MNNMIERVLLDELRQTTRLSSIVGSLVALKPSGHELIGLCPFHNEKTPSFFVNDDKGLYHCFGCGAGGDIIAFVMQIYGLSFPGAVTWLAGVDHVVIDPDVRTKARRRDDDGRRVAIREARLQWNRSVPIAGTAAERYLRRRHITLPSPPSIRFVMAPLRKGQESDGTGHRRPAMIASAVDCEGRLMAVHRVFLTPDGQKAPLAHPKLSLGDTDGCAVRLGGIDEKLLICEGIEDGLTLRQRFDDITVWVSLGTGRMHKLRIPEKVRQITIAADNDEAGMIAAQKACETYESQGRQVGIVRPSLPFKDWNEELCETIGETC